MSGTISYQCDKCGSHEVLVPEEDREFYLIGIQTMHNKAIPGRPTATEFPGHICLPCYNSFWSWWKDDK